VAAVVAQMEEALEPLEQEVLVAVEMAQQLLEHRLVQLIREAAVVAVVMQVQQNNLVEMVDQA
jgi:hypothetical protein